LGRSSSAHGNVRALGEKFEARQRAAREAREDEVLGGPAGLGTSRLPEPLGDRELQTLGDYSGQRVITTFFSV
jgi:hypothetical protein